MISSSADGGGLADRSSSTDWGSPVGQGSPDRSSPSILVTVPLANRNDQIPEPIAQQSNEPSSTHSSNTFTQSDDDIGTHRTPRPRCPRYNDIERLREARQRLAFAIDDTYLRIGRIVETAESRLRNARQHEPVVQNEDSNSNEARQRVAFAIDDTHLRIDRMVETSESRIRNARQLEPVVQNEDSNSNLFSSASEDSNQSLPECKVKEKIDVDEEPPTKLRKITSPDEDLDGETCPICLDIWGNSGNHRLVALKCGHLFGAECVERWLKAQAAKDRSCPTCKTKASLKDLRYIYARRLTAADNSEVTRLQKLVDILQADKCRTELNLQSARITQRALAAQLEDLKRTIAISQGNMKQADRSWRFALEKNLEITKEGGCRVLTYNCRTYEIYASQKSANYLFPGYGVRRVSCVDYTLGQFVHLHSKPIRGITYSQPNDLLLTVGLEGTAKILERGIPNMSINAGVPLWSCAWDLHRPKEFYLGGVGTIYQYDLRNPSTCLRTFSGSGDRSPVVSVWSTEYGPISSQLNSCWLWETKTTECLPKTFPVSGPCLALGYDNEIQKALVTMRPKGTEPSKLAVCSFSPTVRGGADVVVDCVINGSARASVMAKSTFCRTPTATWVAAHSESDSTLYLHGLGGARTMSMPASELALDVCAAQCNGSIILASLSDSRLRIYKGVQTS